MSTISSSAPSNAVPCAHTSKTKRSASGSTAVRRPTSTRTRSTRAPAACSAQTSTTEAAIPSSCMSADSRQLIAGEHVDDALAAERCLHRYHAGRFARDLADDGCIAAGGLGPHRRQHPVRIGGRHDRDELSLVGEVERVEPEDLADATHRLLDRQVAFADPDADANSFSTVATPPRVASRRQRIAGQACSIADTSSASGWQSLPTSASNASWLRAIRTATPCSPSVPLTITASPGRALPADR